MYGKLVEREKRSSRVLTCGAFADIFIDAYHKVFCYRISLYDDGFLLISCCHLQLLQRRLMSNCSSFQSDARPISTDTQRLYI